MCEDAWSNMARDDEGCISANSERFPSGKQLQLAFRCNGYSVRIMSVIQSRGLLLDAPLQSFA